MYFVSCPKQGLEVEAVVLHRVGFLGYFCPKQGQNFKPSAAPLYPKMGQVPPPPPPGNQVPSTRVRILSKTEIFSLTLTSSYSKTFVFDRPHEYEKSPSLKIYSVGSVFKNLRICGQKHHLHVDGRCKRRKKSPFPKYSDTCGRGRVM